MNSSAARKELADYGYRKLAPQIVRQRLIIEGLPRKAICAVSIKHYLADLSRFVATRTLLGPVVHHSNRYGWAGWIQWEASGAQFHAWDRPVLFFSVDLYSCEEIEIASAIAVTRDHFTTQFNYWSY